MQKLKPFVARAAMTLTLALLTTIGAWAQYSGGDGSKETPYIISNVDDLNNLVSLSKKNNY